MDIPHADLYDRLQQDERFAGTTHYGAIKATAIEAARAASVELNLGWISAVTSLRASFINGKLHLQLKARASGGRTFTANIWLRLRNLATDSGFPVEMADVSMLEWKSSNVDDPEFRIVYAIDRSGGFSETLRELLD